MVSEWSTVETGSRLSVLKCPQNVPTDFCDKSPQSPNDHEPKGRLGVGGLYVTMGDEIHFRTHTHWFLNKLPVDQL